jgi:hypothetical protein
MLKQSWLIISLVVPLAIVGCSQEGQDAQEQSRDMATVGSGVPEDNVFSDQVKALEKAEGVQQTLDDAAAAQREEIERQEQR